MVDNGGDNLLLKSLRESAGLTQEAVAAKLNIQRTTVSMWESGDAKPRANKLPALAALYNCTIRLATNDKKYQNVFIVSFDGMNFADVSEEEDDQLPFDMN